MSAEPPCDPRGVANLLLDIIEEKGRRATHIDLQKLLYFAHGRFLIGSGIPLLTGYFEAWRRGPVHPTVYNAFKEAGALPISFRAERTNLVTGHRSEADRESAGFLKGIVDGGVARPSSPRLK